MVAESFHGAFKFEQAFVELELGSPTFLAAVFLCFLRGLDGSLVFECSLSVWLIKSLSEEATVM